MPGKYLEYIRAGRYVVPVELSFLPLNYKDDTGKEVLTSKWVERRHWKEIRGLLKPAVEKVAKYNESGTDRISKFHNILSGDEIAFGYMIHLNKDKCPFVAILDSKKNCWTEDEGDLGSDENSLHDYGGRHKSYTPTKCYIKAYILRRTVSRADDEKKLRKELGIKEDDIRNHFQPGTATGLHSISNQPGPPVAAHDKHKVRSSHKKKKSKRKDKFGHGRRKGFSSSEESVMDLPPPISQSWINNEARNVVNQESHYHGRTMNDRHRRPSGDLSCDSLGLDEHLDTDGEIGHVGRVCFSDSVDDVFSNTNSLFRSWIEDDEDDDFDEELPDIEETISSRTKKVKRTGGYRKKSSNERSPAKSNLSSGLPDIDEPLKGGRYTKNKKKRTVAIVEPMKPVKASGSGQMSLEEAIGALFLPTERRRKARSTSSPTIERLSRSKNSNSAIEILGEDSDLLTIGMDPSRTVAPIRKRKLKDGNERSPRKRRSRKRLDTAIYDRLTPSPFPESPEAEENQEEQDRLLTRESGSESEPEMPVLTKMVYMSDEDGPPTTPPDSPATVSPLERETASFDGPEEENAQVDSANLSQQRHDLNAHSHKNIFRMGLSSSEPEYQASNNSSPISFQARMQHAFRPRIRHASDSDDITSESAYRKTPIIPTRRKKRRKSLRNGIGFGSSVIHSDNSTSTKETAPKRTNAQTQTILNLRSQNLTELTDREPEENNPSEQLEMPVDHEEIVRITKTERTESQSYDSDYAHGAYSDGDDDDVLFEGQFQPNLNMPGSAERSPEDTEEVELFSFERPAPVIIGTQSINRMEQPTSLPSGNAAFPESVTNDDDDIDYSFDYIATSSSTSINRNIVGPGHVHGENVGLHTLQNADTDQQRQTENQSVENLSTFQLMNHPGTLRAGFGLLTKVMSNKVNTKSLYKRYGMEGGKKKGRKKDQELMPLPPTKRPLSPDICSLNPEEQLRKTKWNRRKVVNPVPQPETSMYNRPDSPVAGPSSNMRSSQPYTNRDSFDTDEDEITHTSGEPMFRELMSRARPPERQYEPQGDEFDLSQRSHYMLQVYTDYAEKSRLFKKHVKNINELTTTQLKEHFETIKSQVQGICEGTVESERNRLYCSRLQSDKQRLRRMHVARPFKDEHGNILSTFLYDFLLPHPGSRLQYTDYINYVMRPEAFIRIFSIVNYVSYETAEKEMLAGPCYDGPFMES